MKQPRINPAEKIPLILAEWRTGEYTQRDLAYRHKVSLGFINKHTKDVERDTASTVNKLVEAKQELSKMDEHSVNAVHAIVDEKTKHIQFFNNAALKNVQTAVRKIDESTTQAEHRMLAETILKGRETVLGKSPDTAIQINNGQIQPIGTPAERAEAVRQARDHY